MHFIKRRVVLAGLLAAPALRKGFRAGGLARAPGADHQPLAGGRFIGHHGAAFRTALQRGFRAAIRGG